MALQGNTRHPLLLHAMGEEWGCPAPALLLVQGASPQHHKVLIAISTHGVKKCFLSYDEAGRLTTKNIPTAATVSVEKGCSESFSRQNTLSAPAGAEKGPGLFMGCSVEMLGFSWFEAAEH